MGSKEKHKLWPLIPRCHSDPMEMNARLLPDAGLPSRLLTIVCIHLTFNMTALYDWQKKYSKDCSYIEDE